MLKKSKCFLTFIQINYYLFILCVAGNQYPDVISTFQGPFQDPPLTLQSENFYEENISCDLMMEPMETIRTALNQLEVLRRSYCNNPSASKREPINLPILPSGSRSAAIWNPNGYNYNKGIDLPAKDEDNLMKTTENPSTTSTTIKDNISTTGQKTFVRKPKKKCPPQKMIRIRLGRKIFPFSLYEFYDDHENNDEYYENASYYNDIEK